MNWQVNYALKYLMDNHKDATAQHVRGDAIRIMMPHKPNVMAVISDAYTISAELAMQYHVNFPDMDFLCGYRKECVWEGGAIRYLEGNTIGWGSAGTLGSAIYNGDARSAAHKDYCFSYRLIRQIRSIKNLDREFDRIFTMTLTSGCTVRVGMIMEYEPTADAIRTFWDRFGPIDIAWNINPNGNPTQNAIEAGADLGCEVMKWDELKMLLRNR
ncbi:hypothetical protein [Candidatus Nitrotoga fabula]|uniref:Uncharacterized protein n=1 Tax=Candidatus Nitrotoga fabula TaxID=2182327 RepID=A0A916F951_9PROT|nr:hypothetical protein [Candidatus Nitrotoga fabula]CAE6699073.1 conserved hypothetical protein [Candidatus Nitrotoga fabula]